MDNLTKLNSMSKPELINLAKKFNAEYKIVGIYKKKKKDLITELAYHADELNRVLNLLDKDLKSPVKGKRKMKKKELSDSEIDDVLLEMNKLNKLATKAKTDREKVSLLKQIEKLNKKIL
jgi:hypothetical protein